MVESSQWSRPLSRLLVLLTMLLLLVMPITEHLCNWDHFLRGGQDVEFNLLAGLLFLALVMLAMNRAMMRPELVVSVVSCGPVVIPDASPRRGASQRAAILSDSASLSLNLPAALPASCALAPLRI
jgi:hypothetical protein